eukprot:TRINITY_DN4890_c0_g3_i1.p1 TRINITY_DN4890_c0_g3~~TRINITY_DN4890_c0_g3_i1.p1  ORF type:complete len:561 (+),score=161.90 TRINITY_DN4890_c0_g3_i1:68-1750(+)
MLKKKAPPQKEVPEPEQGRKGKKKRKSKGGLLPGQSAQPKPSSEPAPKKAKSNKPQPEEKKSKKKKEPTPEPVEEEESGEELEQDVLDGFVSDEDEKKEAPLSIGKREPYVLIDCSERKEKVPALPPLEGEEDRGKVLFEWLIWPMKADEFFESVWEKRPLLIKRHAVAPNFYKQVFVKSDLESLLRQGLLRYTYDLDLTRYTNDTRETLNPEGVATPETVWDKYNSGCSIRLLRPQLHHDRLWEILSVLESFFFSFTGANIYMTPKGTQGFAPHYDDIEAFVLQTEGAKRWRLYEPRYEHQVLARESSQNFKQDEIGQPFLDTLIQTGDLLYFPRGCVHQAVSSKSEHSLHVTISTAQSNSWQDYLSEALKASVPIAANEHLPIRRSVPRDYFQYMGFANSEKDDDRRESFMDLVLEHVTKVVEHLPFDFAADQRSRFFLRERLPPFLYPHELAKCTGGAEAESTLTGESMVRLVRGDCVRLLFEEGMAVVYHCFDNHRGYHQHEEQSIEFSSEFGPAFEHLLESYPEAVSVSSFPELEPEDQVEFAQVLFDNRLIRFE